MKRWLATSAVGVLGLLLAACGGASAASPAELAKNPELTGKPVVIGVQTPHNGPSAYPQSTYGAQAAAYYINHELGGINGRPLQLDVCKGDGSPETAINCANGFVASDIPVLFDAYDGTSIGPMVPVMQSANIPIVGLLAGQGVAESQPLPTAFYFSGPLETSALGMVTILDKLGKQNAVLAVTEAPSSHTYVNELVKPMGEKLGVDVTAIYTEVTDINFTTLAATELSKNPDVAGLIALPEDGCTDLIEALRQQGYEGTIFAGSCSQFVSELPSEMSTGAIMQPRLWVPLAKKHAPPEVQQELTDFAESMEAVGYGDELSARSLYSFAGVVNLARILQGIDGEITNQTVATAMMNVKNFDTFAGPTVTCDGKQWPGKPGACSHKAIFFEVQPDGSLKPVGGEGFIELDPTLLSSS